VFSSGDEKVGETACATPVINNSQAMAWQGIQPADAFSSSC
jgi:hypothetical protein